MHETHAGDEVHDEAQSSHGVCAVAGPAASKENNTATRSAARTGALKAISACKLCAYVLYSVVEARAVDCMKV